MQHSGGEHAALIDRLLAEKDRLLIEKDELIESKARMWSECQKIMHDQDHQIAMLRNRTQMECLMAEKDRLVIEKDELVESKAKMWRKYQKIKHEQDLEIEKLREQNGKLLAALTAYVEGEDERGSTQAMDTSVDDDAQDETEDNPLPDDSGFGRTFSDAYPSPEASVRHEEGSQDPDKVQVQFRFSPVITVSIDGELRFGDFERVPDAVKATMQKAEDIRARRVALNLLAASPVAKSISCCFYLWAQGSATLRRWTIDLPQKYACASCFNGRRVCMAWQGDKTWALLPLPPQLRKAETTWEDAAYYIYGGDSRTKASDFEDIWAEGKDSRKRKR